MMIQTFLILFVCNISPRKTLHPPFGSYPPTSFSNSFFNPADYYYKKFKQNILLPIQRPAIGILSGNLGFFRRNKVHTNPVPILERNHQKQKFHQCQQIHTQNLSHHLIQWSNSNNQRIRIDLLLNIIILIQSQYFQYDEI